MNLLEELNKLEARFLRERDRIESRLHAISVLRDDLTAEIVVVPEPKETPAPWNPAPEIFEALDRKLEEGDQFYTYIGTSMVFVVGTTPPALLMHIIPMRSKVPIPADYVPVEFRVPKEKGELFLNGHGAAEEFLGIVHIPRRIILKRKDS